MLATIISIIALVIQLQTKTPASLSPTNIKVQLGSFQLYEDNVIPVFVGIENFRKNSVYIATLPLIIENSGDSTINNLSVVSNFPALSRKEISKIWETTTEGPLRKQLKPSFNDLQEIGHFSVHSISLPQLNPGLNFSIDQPFFLTPTEKNINVETKDGYSLGVNVGMLLKTNFSINAENTPLKNYNATISIRKTKDKKSISNIAVNYLYEKLIEQKNSLNWINQIIFSDEKVAIVGFTEPKLHMKLKQGNLYRVDYKPEDLRLITVDYKPKWPKYVLLISIPILFLMVFFRLWLYKKWKYRIAISNNN